MKRDFLPEYEEMPSPISLPVRDALELIAEQNAPAYGMDRHDRIVYWNEGAEKALGWSAEEVLGKM